MRKTKWPLSSIPNTSIHTNTTDPKWEPLLQICQQFRNRTIFGNSVAILNSRAKNRAFQNQLCIPSFCDFEVQVVPMKVALANDYHFAHNIMTLTSRVS